MFNFLDTLYFKGKAHVLTAANRIKEDETGVSAFVATILLIVIVVALCALFWENISTWFDKTWTSITGDADKIGK